VRTRDRDRYLSVLYAPAAVRPALLALHGIDLEMASVVVGTTEPMIGEIRLAWWREALQGLDRGVVPAQPLLALAAAELLPRGIAGESLAEIEDRWREMIGNPVVPPSHVTGGGGFFGLLASVLGGDPVVARQLGEAWVIGEAPSGNVPGVLRPLLGLVRLAVRDAARARAGQPMEERGSLGRQWVLLKAVVAG
jgi:phytoene synthase